MGFAAEPKEAKASWLSCQLPWKELGKGSTWISQSTYNGGRDPGHGSSSYPAFVFVNPCITRTTMSSERPSCGSFWRSTSLEFHRASWRKHRGMCHIIESRSLELQSTWCKPSSAQNPEGQNSESPGSPDCMSNLTLK